VGASGHVQDLTRFLKYYSSGKGLKGVSKNYNFRQEMTFFEGGWHTFWPIILERLNFKGRGFQDSYLGSLALLAAYGGQSSNENWGSCGG